VQWWAGSCCSFPDRLGRAACWAGGAALGERLRDGVECESHHQKQATVTKKTAVDTWTCPTESIVANDAIKRSDEPSVYWERKAVKIFADDVKSFSIEELSAFIDDMQIKWDTLNDKITMQYALLAEWPETHQHASNGLKFRIRENVRKKTYIKMMRLNAIKQKVAYLDKEIPRNKANPSVSPKSKLKSKIVTNQTDYNSLIDLDRKMSYFKNREFNTLVHTEVGDTKFTKLKRLAIQQAVTSFQSWAATTDASPKLIEHVLQENLKQIPQDL
jgi:hypothetical protein